MSVLQLLYDHQCSLAGIREILRYRHIQTHMHSERVVLMADAFAKACALNPADHKTLLYSAMFHDIGKIGIPDDILMFEGKLDEAQRTVMQQHSTIGETIVTLMRLERGDEIALHVRHHHEHFDGSGYPDALAGEAIPLLSRMLGILDSYDALRETRPYRPALDHTTSVVIMSKERGLKHDPELLDVFLNVNELEMIGEQYNEGNRK